MQPCREALELAEQNKLEILQGREEPEGIVLLYCEVLLATVKT